MRRPVRDRYGVNDSQRLSATSCIPHMAMAFGGPSPMGYLLVREA